METSWELLVMLRKDDPMTIAAYAKKQKSLEQRGWKWAKHLAKQEKKLVRLMKITRASKRYEKKSFGATYEFGVEVPRTGDIRRARALDKENGDTMWFDAQ
eukprot:2883497-Ditylum_brightwellii.AAC.3